MRAVFYRTFLAGIVLFWLVMTGLLVRIELFPGKEDVLPVPVSYVGRLIFLHQQSSTLVLYNPQRQRLGTMHLDPQHVPAPAGDGFVDNLRSTGEATVNLPGLPNARMTYNCLLQLNEAQQLQSFEGTATFHTLKTADSPKQREPAWTIKFDGRPPLNQFHYLVRQDDTVEKEASGTPAELLADPDLSLFGVDPRTLLEQVQARPGGATGGKEPAGRMAVSAHRGNLHFNGDEIETFVVTARYADSLDTTIHVSQLGQVLLVKTFTGYNFYDDTLTP